MLTKIKEVLKKNDKVYVFLKCIGSINNADFLKLIKCYYGWSKESANFAPLTIEHLGGNHPDRLIYLIYYSENVMGKKLRGHSGMFANIRRVLEWLNFADILGMTPVVMSGNSDTYYDEEMDQITTNVFEYYFNPVSDIRVSEVKDCYNVVKHRYGHSNFYMKHGCDKDSYNVTENEIERLGYLYKKYIHLNKASEEYIDNEISELLCNKKTLGLHIRGTDYKLHLKNHPNYISCNEYISLAKKIVVENNFEQIFLATDDLEILNTFQREFEGKLVYYKDTFRTTGKEGTHNTHDSRPLHYYKLGLEVLRDVYTLANCDSLVCGLSQVSFAARYVSIALGRKFDEVVVLNNGINESNTKLAKRKNKTLSKTGNVES